jgi:hypothetical protein
LRIEDKIRNLYEEAGVKYRLAQNQEIKITRANLLLNLILKNINKFNLELIRYSTACERGIDILGRGESGMVGIELKAYNKNEKLKQRDIEQLLRFIKMDCLATALLITTTDLSDNMLDVSKNIRVIRFSELKNMVRDADLMDLEYIRNTSVNLEDMQRQVKKQKILDYVLRKYKEENKKPGINQIAQDTHLDIYTYFKNLFEIYKVLKIPPPLRNMSGGRTSNPDWESISLWKDEFKKYILERINSGEKYPSGCEIARHFGIASVWNITEVSALHEELGLKSYLKREKRVTSA